MLALAGQTGCSCAGSHRDGENAQAQRGEQAAAGRED
jgi:hypothetical protein